MAQASLDQILDITRGVGCCATVRDPQSIIQLMGLAEAEEPIEFQVGSLGSMIFKVVGFYLVGRSVTALVSYEVDGTTYVFALTFAGVELAADRLGSRSMIKYLTHYDTATQKFGLREEIRSR